MIGLPHRVGAAYVVLGQANGTQKRVGHFLNSNVYGDASPAQFHSYYSNYPTTTPDKDIVKVAGTLGETYTYTSPTSNDIPGNIIKIVSYKTELNHYIPTYAADADFNIPSYDSEDIWTTRSSPPSGNSGYYIPSSYLYDPDTGMNIEYQYIDTLTQFTGFVTGLKDSWTSFTDVTDNLGGEVEGFIPSVFYPRWTDEGAYEQYGQLNNPIAVSITGDDTFYQTREGPAMTIPASQIGTYWFCPWTIGRVPESGLNQRLNIDCNVSYKFTKDGTHASGSAAEQIVYPWGKYTFVPEGNRNIPDESPRLKDYDVDGFYSGKIPAGTYRTTLCTIWPVLEDEDYPYVNYQNTATHGLFLAANGSCWNIGAEIKVKVHVWKCPPKFCLYYRNEAKDGGGTAYDNWKSAYWYSPSTTPVYEGGFAFVCPQIYGPGTGLFNDGTFRFEGGINTGVDYSIPEPKNLQLHYWGTVLALDTDSELNVEHEVLEFTVTISEANTYMCNGDPREGVSMTPEGFKLADIELEPIEGYITYIKDFEVTSVKKPPAT